MRIHFTRTDLARLRIADGPDAMWELVNSLQALQSRYGKAALGGWRQRVASDLRHRQLATQVRHRLFPVAPHASYFPDLLTPPEGSLGVAAGVEAVLSTSRRRLGIEIGRIAQGPGGWLADLSAGRQEAVTELGDTLRGYFEVAVAPYWSLMREAVATDLNTRRAATNAGGVDALLNSFRPAMQWRDPVLDLPGHPSRRDIYLDGQGLVLVPSYFCQLHPLTIFDPELPQVVVYPIERQPAMTAGSVDGHRALGRLLGETRAAVLLAAVDGASTGELAVRLGLSAAVISHHTTILRDAGLITTRRSANTARHSRTLLGDALVYRHITTHRTDR